MPSSVTSVNSLAVPVDIPKSSHSDEVYLEKIKPFFLGIGKLLLEFHSDAFPRKYAKLEKYVEKLAQEGLVDLSLAKASLANTKELCLRNLASLENWLEDLKKDAQTPLPLISTKHGSCVSFTPLQALEKCQTAERTSLIVPILLHHTQPFHSIICQGPPTAFLLDKTCQSNRKNDPSALEGTSAHFCGAYFKTTLAKMAPPIKHSSFGKWVYPLLKAKLKAMDTLLNDQIKWAFLSKEKANAKLVVDEVIHKISHLADGEATLIPLGCVDHSVALKISRVGKNAILSLYNAGSGVVKHHRWIDQNLYQTCRQKYDVPLKDLCDSVAWTEAFRLTRESPEIYPLYSLIFDQMGKQGNLAPPSAYREEYERKQYQGTCSAQTLMAWNRHELMSVPLPTAQEKLAFYKIVKAHQHMIMAESTRQSKKTYRFLLKIKKQKYQAVLQLAHLASDFSSFSKAVQAFQSALQQLDRPSLTSTNFSLEDCQERPFLRYYLLRELSHEVVQALQAKSKEEIDVFSRTASPELRYALLIAQNRYWIKARFFAYLADCLKQGDLTEWAKEIIKASRSSPFLEDLKDYLAQNRSHPAVQEGIPLIMSHVTRYGDAGQKFLEDLGITSQSSELD